MYYIAYNPTMGNVLVGISESFFVNTPNDVVVQEIQGDFPDLSRKVWNPSLLQFEDNNNLRVITPTEFMRKFTLDERLAIRALESSGDLVIKDALELIKGTKDGVNLDDSDVLKTLQYLAYVKQVIQPYRIEEIIT